jgi:hypothetical protein
VSTRKRSHAVMLSRVSSDCVLSLPASFNSLSPLLSLSLWFFLSAVSVTCGILPSPRSPRTIATMKRPLRFDKEPLEHVHPHPYLLLFHVRTIHSLAFEDCARGKTVSIVWYCREVKDKMYACLRAK